MKNAKIYTLPLLLLVALVALASCEGEIDHRGRTPLVGIGKDVLYKEDVAALYVTALPTIDSTAFVRDYMRRWLEDVLFFRMAQRNVPSAGEVERLVENYRRALLLNIYQERLIEQQLRPTLTQAEIDTFYYNNSELFKLEEPLVQGVFLKLPIAAPRIAAVRKWLTKLTPEDIENLEKYSITNAVTYDYFVDSWQSLPSIAAKMPLTVEALEKSIEKREFVEVADSAHRYMLSVVTMLKKGENKPVELASDEIHSLLLNSMKADFVKQVKRDLYDKAFDDGKIIFYDTESSAMLTNAEQIDNK